MTGAMAQTFNYKGTGAYDLKYTVNGGTTTVTCKGMVNKGDAGAADLVIPESVSNNGTTYSVTSIGANAFRDCSGFTGSLTIGNSVTSIGERAFYGCRGFTGSLTIPNSVTSIGESAFYNCSGFTGSLTIPNSVTSIGASAFRGCKGFTGSLTIGNSVTSIENEAFYACRGFKGSLTIPNSVTSIGYSAFNYCTGLTDLTMLNLTPPTVGRYVFDNVTFTAVSVPAGAVAAYDAQTLNGDADADGKWQGLTIEESVPTSVASAQVVPFTRIQNTLYFAQPTAVAVYNVSGTMLHSGEVMEYTLPNAAGVYIIRTANGSVKVLSK